MYTYLCYIKKNVCSLNHVSFVLPYVVLLWFHTALFNNFLEINCLLELVIENLKDFSRIFNPIGDKNTKK